MTAEVVIMNAIGVAMAADSAVTIGTDARKIFTSTDKLFQLTASEPIGVMTYGNALLLGVPWETIVKQYRAFIGNRKLPTVADYASTFLRFVARNTTMFPTKVQDEHVRMLIARLFAHFRDAKLAVAIDSAAKKTKSGEVREDDIGEIAERSVAAFSTEILDDSKRIRGFDAQSIARIERRHRAMVKQEFESAFGTLPIKAGTKRKLSNLAFAVLSREAFGPMSSGLVFAGFGAKEYMPHLVHYHAECFADRKLRVSSPDWTHIEPLGTTASIIPFAQKEMVEMFMEGVDRTLRERFSNQSSAALRQVSQSLVAAVESESPALAKRMRRVLKTGLPRVMEELNKRWDSFSSVHWRPITEIVATLPKDELAAMAEAIVNLTKFKRRITPQRETVGGPIDVAVITRGDGFVWIRRKHYFEPALNPRVMARFTAC